MKKVIGLLLAGVMVFALSACGTGSTNEQSGITASQVSSESVSEEEETSAAVAGNTEETESVSTETENNGTNTLVVYFSATGTTKTVAETMADALSADIYEITPVEVYTEEDLNYNDRSTRATAEQNDPSVRPQISGTVENWDQYDTVLIGFPIWWGEEPRIVDTFVENYDFTGKQVGVFCTSGGSSLGNSAKNLESNAGSGTWLGGTRFNSGASADDVKDWAADLGISV